MPLRAILRVDKEDLEAEMLYNCRTLPSSERQTYMLAGSRDAK